MHVSAINFVMCVRRSGPAMLCHGQWRREVVQCLYESSAWEASYLVAGNVQSKYLTVWTLTVLKHGGADCHSNSDRCMCVFIGGNFI